MLEIVLKQGWLKEFSLHKYMLRFSFFFIVAFYGLPMSRMTVFLLALACVMENELFTLLFFFRFPFVPFSNREVSCNSS